MMEEVVRAQGHEHVSAEHASTLEVTSDEYLTPAGDCIVGVEADRAPVDFDDGFVDACGNASATITATIEVGDRRATIEGRGDPKLTFESDRSHVCRTSEYVDERTVMVGADAAAGDLERGLVDALSGGPKVTFTLRVE